MVTFIGRAIGHTAGPLHAVFGNVGVNASVESDDTILCQTPMQVSAGRVAVELHSYSASLGVVHSTFFYFEPANVIRIVPVHGPIAGGTRITIERERADRQEAR